MVFPASFAAAGDVSIAEFLGDPGFEKQHGEHQQLNAKGVARVNGWSAAPENANVWTSVNYMSRQGMAPGDKRPGIAPAEGQSYLRMLTINSSDWLALRSPAFALKAGSRRSSPFRRTGAATGCHCVSRN